VELELLVSKVLLIRIGYVENFLCFREVCSVFLRQKWIN